MTTQLQLINIIIIFNAHYTLQYRHLDVRSDPVHNIHGTAVCIAYCAYVHMCLCAYVLSMKTACIADMLLIITDRQSCV